MYYIIKPTALLLTLVTAFSVLVHDTKLDRATMTALSAPAVFAAAGYGATYAAREMKITSDPHVHVETVSENLRRMVTSQPRLQTRNTDDKKYLATKKASLNNASDENTLVFIPA